MTSLSTSPFQSPQSIWGDIFKCILDHVIYNKNPPITLDKLQNPNPTRPSSSGVLLASLTCHSPFPPAQQAPGTLSLSHSPRNHVLSPLEASHVLTDNSAMCHFLRRPSPMSLAGRRFSNGTCSKACITARSLQLLGKHLLCQAAGVRDSSASFTDRS